MRKTNSRPIIFTDEEVHKALLDNSIQFMRPAEPKGQCPYGVPGDLLWVQEEWYENTLGGRIGYTTEAPPSGISYSVVDPGELREVDSRITLKLTSARREYVKDVLVWMIEADVIKREPTSIAINWKLPACER